MSFILSKILWSLLAPANIFALLFLGLVFMACARQEKQRRVAIHGLLVLAFAIFLLGLFPIGAFLLRPIENRFPAQIPDHVDGIAMLAGAEDPFLSQTRAPPVLGDTAQRYITFATLARQYPEARLAFIGGTPTLSPDKRLSNAALAKETLAGLGVPVDRVVFEDLSRNTYENATFAYRDVKPLPQENWLLVTSAFHMPRAMGCFRKAGWHVFAAPTDYRTAQTMTEEINFNLFRHLSNFQTALHEYIGLAAYAAMGRTDRLWPKAKP